MATVMSSDDVRVWRTKDKEIHCKQLMNLDADVKRYLTALKWFELKPATNTYCMAVHAAGSDVFAQVQPAGTPVSIIAVCGRVRTGKSYLMNALAKVSDLFVTSSQAHSFTHGVHVSSRTFNSSAFGPLSEGASGTELAFVDMEGQGNQGVNYDVKLVSPLLLVSKVLLLNVQCSTGPVRDEILDSLASMMRAARQLHATRREPVKCYGHLHVVLRDSPQPEEECYQIIFGLREAQRAQRRAHEPERSAGAGAESL